MVSGRYLVITEFGRKSFIKHHYKYTPFYLETKVYEFTQKINTTNTRALFRLLFFSTVRYGLTKFRILTFVLCLNILAVDKNCQRRFINVFLCFFLENRLPYSKRNKGLIYVKITYKRFQIPISVSCSFIR